MDIEIKLNLERMANTLNMLSKNDNATMQYCMLSDAVFWTDEVPSKDATWETEFSHTLRYVFHYRTHRLLRPRDDRFKEIFVAAQELFPNWPGFHKARMINSSDFETFYREAKIRADQNIRELE